MPPVEHFEVVQEFELKQHRLAHEVLKNVTEFFSQCSASHCGDFDKSGKSPNLTIHHVLRPVHELLMQCIDIPGRQGDVAQSAIQRPSSLLRGRTSPVSSRDNMDTESPNVYTHLVPVATQVEPVPVQSGSGGIFPVDPASRFPYAGLFGDGNIPPFETHHDHDHWQLSMTDLSGISAHVGIGPQLSEQQPSLPIYPTGPAQASSDNVPLPGWNLPKTSQPPRRDAFASSSTTSVDVFCNNGRGGRCGACPSCNGT